MLLNLISLKLSTTFRKAINLFSSAMSHQLTKLFLLTFLLLTMAQTAKAYWLENEPEPSKFVAIEPS